MIKDIRYSGHAAQPSPYESPDGQLDLSLNLLCEDGHIKPVAAPATLFIPLAGRPVIIHTVTGNLKNYICLLESAQKTKVYWQRHDSVSSTLIAEFNDVLDITAVGNTLVIATSDGIFYALWKTDGYIPLGHRPPSISIDFGMYKISILNESGTFSIPASCEPVNTTLRPNLKRDKAEKEDLAMLTQMAYGLLLPELQEKVISKGYFYMPFFIRYAFRLYDGSYAWHSAPLLMLPSVMPPIIKYSSTGKDPEEGFLDAKLTLNVPYFGLSHRILPDGVDTLQDWADIVSSIDVFISSPIYTYDQSKDIDWVPFVSLRKILSRISPPGQDSALPDQVFAGHFADSVGSPYVDHTMDTTGPGTYLNIKPHPDFHRNVESRHDFYKVAEIDVKDIKAMAAMTPLKFKDENMTALETRTTLPDDFRSHFPLRASSLFSYNSRLCLCGLEIMPADPFPIRTLMQFGNPGSGSVSNASITVWSRINGIRCHAVHVGNADREADRWYSPASNFPRYIFYPDASAYKMKISVPGIRDYIIDLKPHDFLNGAFWYRGIDALSVDPAPAENASQEESSTPDRIAIQSKIYISEVNNPFVFPAEGIVTVGTGNVISLSTAAKALSQGQFGQFPLYAFTSEGVWALEVSSTGTIAARQPITRDVILECTRPLQMDSAVLFITVRGIMLISGSQTQCITDAINSVESSDVSRLPGMAKLHSMLGHGADTCLPAVPFLEFIAECGMLYDYVHQRVVVYNPRYTYAYVFSLKSKEWGMMFSSIGSGINSYPEALAVNHDGALLNFSSMEGEETKGLFVTRPLKLDAPDVLKTMDTVIQRGRFQKGHVQSVLYGSRDLVSWYLIWSSKDHFLRGFRGTPYKYFRIACLTTLSVDESISGASLRFTPRLTDQPR